MNTRPPTRSERQAAMALAAQGAARVPPAVPDAPNTPPEPVPAQPREATARERLEALAARRMAGGGYLIQPPGQMTLESARKWLQQVAEVGSAGDVEIAWVKGIDNIYIKSKLDAEYHQLRSVADGRIYVLEQAAAAEDQAERQAWLERTQKANHERAIAAAEARVAALKAQKE